MSIFDVFRRGKPAIPPDSVQDLPDVRGPLGSRAAARLVQPAAAALSSDAVLQRVQSGQSILHDGRSHTWEFMLVFASLKCTAIFTLEAAESSSDPDAPPLQLRRQFTPLTRSGEGPNTAAVPWSFADSPAVVAALTRAGADFVAGPTDMAIFTATDPSGRLAWRTHYYDRTLEVPDEAA